MPVELFDRRHVHEAGHALAYAPVAHKLTSFSVTMGFRIWFFPIGIGWGDGYVQGRFTWPANEPTKLAGYKNNIHCAGAAAELVVYGDAKWSAAEDDKRRWAENALIGPFTWAVDQVVSQFSPFKPTLERLATLIAARRRIGAAEMQPFWAEVQQGISSAEQGRGE